MTQENPGRVTDGDGSRTKKKRTDILWRGKFIVLFFSMLAAPLDETECRQTSNACRTSLHLDFLSGNSVPTLRHSGGGGGVHVCGLENARGFPSLPLSLPPPPAIEFRDEQRKKTNKNNTEAPNEMVEAVTSRNSATPQTRLSAPRNRHQCNKFSLFSSPPPIPKKSWQPRMKSVNFSPRRKYYPNQR